MLGAQEGAYPWEVPEHQGRENGGGGEGDKMILDLGKRWSQLELDPRVPAVTEPAAQCLGLLS